MYELLISFYFSSAYYTRDFLHHDGVHLTYLGTEVLADNNIVDYTYE